MNSSRPYLLRAIYQWLIDNQLTPYVMVDALIPKVVVPEQHIENGTIVLNISPEAVVDLQISNDVLEFEASFSNIVHFISVPVIAIQAIYAFENGRGMVFQDDEEDEGGGDFIEDDSDDDPPRPKGPPNLKVVK